MNDKEPWKDEPGDTDVRTMTYAVLRRVEINALVGYPGIDWDTIETTKDHIETARKRLIALEGNIARLERMMVFVAVAGKALDGEDETHPELTPLDISIIDTLVLALRDEYRNRHITQNYLTVAETMV